MEEEKRPVRIKACGSSMDPAILADNDDRTCWSTDFEERPLAEISMDLSKISNLGQLCLTPEQYPGQDIRHNDRPGRYRLSYSLDGIGYTCLTEDGVIPYADFNDNSPKFLPLSGITARYIRLELTEPTGRRPDGRRRISLSGLECLPWQGEEKPLEPDENTVEALRQAILSGTAPKSPLDFFHPRGSLSHTFRKLRLGEPVCIAFLGGSITEMDGWRNRICQWFRDSFPENHEISFIHAGISSFDSGSHAFRIKKDILALGQPDLLFLEAAVNDEYNGRTADEIRKAYEGMILQLRRLSPPADIVILHFADDLKIEEYGKTRRSHIIDTQEQAASHYSVPSLDLSLQVCRSLEAGEYTWKTFGGLHPAPFGHRIYALHLMELLSAYRLAEEAGLPPASPRLPEPMGPAPYAFGCTLDPWQAQKALTLHGFRIEPCWDPADGIGTRTDFADVPMVLGTKPGDRLEFRFTGTALQLFTASGPRSCRLRFSVDGEPWQQRDLHTDWSDGLHLPWVTMLRNDLNPGPHHAVLEILDNPEHPDRTLCPIRYFLVNPC